MTLLRIVVILDEVENKGKQIMAIKKARTINGCGTAILYDATGKSILMCNDTPNAIAVAFREHPEAHSVKDMFLEHPKEFGRPQHLRVHYLDRFNTDLTIEKANIRYY